MLYGDARDAWDTGLLRDPRVRHYWDEKQRLGLYLAGRELGGLGGGVVWDAFYVFGAHASWLDAPGPIVAAGSTVIDNTDVFARALVRVL